MSHRGIPKSLAAAHTSLLTKGPLEWHEEASEGGGGGDGVPQTVGGDGGMHYGKQFVGLQKERAIFAAHNVLPRDKKDVVDTSQAGFGLTLHSRVSGWLHELPAVVNWCSWAHVLLGLSLPGVSD